MIMTDNERSCQAIGLNSNLLMLRSKSKLILSSMSKYDEEFMGYFTGLFGYRLYSYGGYYVFSYIFFLILCNNV